MSPPFRAISVSWGLQFKAIHGKSRHGVQRKRIALATQNFPLASGSKKGRREMWFALGIVGLKQVKGHFVTRGGSPPFGRVSNIMKNNSEFINQSARHRRPKLSSNISIYIACVFVSEVLFVCICFLETLASGCDINLSSEAFRDLQPSSNAFSPIT